MKYYKIKRILHTGVDGERNTPRTDGRYPMRIGRIVQFSKADIIIDKPFWLRYICDENGNDYSGMSKRTSYVVNYETTIIDQKEYVRLETYRTIYEFEEVLLTNM